MPRRTKIGASSDGIDPRLLWARLLAVCSHSWDGASGTRQGAFVLPFSPQVAAEPDSWSDDDTVIIHRKAG